MAPLVRPRVGRRGPARGVHPPRRPGHARLHRRHDRTVEGLRDQPELPRADGRAEHGGVGSDGHRRRVDPAPPVPLQRDPDGGDRHARRRRPRRHRAPVLGVQLLAAGQRRGGDHGVAARFVGGDDRSRPRPPRATPVRSRAREHDAAPGERRAHAARDRRHLPRALRRRHLELRLRHHRGVPALVAATRRSRQARLRRRGEQRRLRRPHLRRRRQRGAARHEPARSSAGPASPT